MACQVGYICRVSETKLAKRIKTFNTAEFLGSFMKPDPKLQQIIKKDYGKFFIVKVQDLIKISKLPIPPTRATTHTIIYLTLAVRLP
jgi:AraC family transcriptional regulator, transcriptional activator of pobA